MSVTLSRTGTQARFSSGFHPEFPIRDARPSASAITGTMSVPVQIIIISAITPQTHKQESAAGLQTSGAQQKGILMRPTSFYAGVRRPQGRKRRPQAHGPGSLTVTDGLYVAGSIVPLEGRFFAFDATGTLIGEFDTKAKAMAALPDADLLGEITGPGIAS